MQQPNQPNQGVSPALQAALGGDPNGQNRNSPSTGGFAAPGGAPGTAAAAGGPPAPTRWRASVSPGLLAASMKGAPAQVTQVNNEAVYGNFRQMQAPGASAPAATPAVPLPQTPQMPQPMQYHGMTVGPGQPFTQIPQQPPAQQYQMTAASLLTTQPSPRPSDAPTLSNSAGSLSSSSSAPAATYVKISTLQGTAPAIQQSPMMIHDQIAQLQQQNQQIQQQMQQQQQAQPQQLQQQPAAPVAPVGPPVTQANASPVYASASQLMLDATYAPAPPSHTPAPPRNSGPAPPGYVPPSPLVRMESTRNVSNSMSKQDAKRQNIMFETLETEKSYVGFLRYVIANCVVPARTQRILSDQQIKQVFSNIESLVELHAIFLKELEMRIASWTPATCLGDIFLRYVNAFHVYQEYINNFDQSQAVMAQLLKRNLPFAGLENSMMTDPTFRKLTLGAYLIMPIQRIPRYVLLIDDLVRHTDSSHADFDHLKLAAARFKTMSQQINTRKGEAESIQRAFEIDKQLQLPDNKKLLKPNRRFLEEKEATLIGVTGTQAVICFFFNDAIFIAKRKDKSARGYVFIGRLKVRDIKVQAVGITEAKQRMKRFEVQSGKPIELPRTQAFLVVSTIDGEEFLLALNSEQDQAAWVTRVQTLRRDVQAVILQKIDVPVEPHARFWHSCTTISPTKFAVVGGQYTEWSSRGAPVWLDDCWTFDINSSIWEQIRIQKPFALAEHSVAVWENKLIVYGGHNFGEYSQKLYSVDIATGAVTERGNAGTAPAARSRHSSVLINRRLYVFGGSVHGAASRMDNELYEYNLDSSFWSVVPLRTSTRPSVRYGHVAVEYKGYMYIFGGRNSQQDLNDMYIFDPNQQMWFQNVEMSGTIPSPRQAVSATVIADKGFMILLGGESATQVFNDIFIFHFELNQWSRLVLPVPMLPRMAAGMFVSMNAAQNHHGQHASNHAESSPYAVLSHTTIWTYGGRVQNDDGIKVPTSEVVSIPLSDKWLQVLPDPDHPTGQRIPGLLDLWHQFRSRDVDKLNVKLSPFNVRTSVTVPSFLFHMKNNAPAFNWDGNPNTLTFVEKIGSGSYGEVFLVSYEDVFAACKVVKLKASLLQTNPAQFGALVSALTNQVVLLSRCRNASLVQYYGAVAVDETTIWILSEYFPTGSVKELIRSSAISEKFVATAAAQSLLGLSYLHSHGIVARCMKAGNLLVTDKGDIKISDYGLSPWIDEVVESRMAVENAASYLAPETTSTTPSWTFKADIYSLGVTLVEIAENTPPFKVLQKTKKWSPELVEFVGLCLTSVQMKRPEAISILQHPFLDIARATSVIEALAIRRFTNRKTMSEQPKPTHEKQQSSNATLRPGSGPRASTRTVSGVENEATVHAIRHLVRRYREELFKDNLPYDVADKVDKKFEDLESELIFLLSAGTKSGVAVSESSSGSARASIYAASSNPLISGEQSVPTMMMPATPTPRPLPSPPQ